MVLKVIGATEARTGTNIIIEGVPCTIKKIDISKTGRHGHAKARIEAVGMINGQKKVFIIPGHDKLEVPTVEKRKGQVISTAEINNDGKASVMDLESFETLEISCSEDVKEDIAENSNVEYWDIEGEKIIKRKL